MERAPRSTDGAAPAPTRADVLAPLPGRIASGDEAALEALYLATRSRVFGLALRILREREAAEEALVDVYAQVWRQAARFDPSKGTVQVWIGTLARTRAIDLARIQRRRARREAPLPAEADAAWIDHMPGPLEHAADGDAASRLRRALAGLPAEQRRAVELAFFGGYSHREVARALRAPLGTIKTRIRSGLSHLRAELSALEERP